MLITYVSKKKILYTSYTCRPIQSYPKKTLFLSTLSHNTRYCCFFACNLCSDSYMWKLTFTYVFIYLFICLFINGVRWLYVNISGSFLEVFPIQKCQTMICLILKGYGAMKISNLRLTESYVIQQRHPFVFAFIHHVFSRKWGPVTEVANSENHHDQSIGLDQLIQYPVMRRLRFERPRHAVNSVLCRSRSTNDPDVLRTAQITLNL
jgi:hypothetical protein